MFDFDSGNKKRSIEFISDFLSSSESARFVLGRNNWSASVIANLEVSGVVDDFTNEKFFHGIRILKSSELEKASMVLNCSTVRTVTVKESLDTLGIRNLDYYSFQRFSNLPLLGIREKNWSLWEEDLKENLSKYYWIRSLLNDKNSLDTFDSIINFRVDCNIQSLAIFSYNPDIQYFEEFLDLNNEVFFDIGAFDGNTTKLFRKIDSLHKLIVMFEPDPSNIQSIKKSVPLDSKSIIEPYGLSSDNKTAQFQGGGGSASHFSKDGNLIIDQRKGDDFVHYKPTFLKMDIEGLELEALVGFKETISNLKPKMAISVYHEPDHIWSIPEFVLSVNPDYEIKLRHYTQGQMETVMYFY